MPSTDPISDMLTSIRNANLRLQEKTDVPASKFKISVLRVLKNEGFISNYKLMEERKKKFIRVYLRYTPTRQPVMLGIRRISKPGLRIYSPYQDLRVTDRTVRVNVVSTSKGLMTGEQAYKNKMGGELICEVW